LLGFVEIGFIGFYKTHFGGRDLIPGPFVTEDRAADPIHRSFPLIDFCEIKAIRICGRAEPKKNHSNRKKPIGFACHVFLQIIFGIEENGVAACREPANAIDVPVNFASEYRIDIEERASLLSSFKESCPFKTRNGSKLRESAMHVTMLHKIRRGLIKSQEARSQVPMKSD